MLAKFGIVVSGANFIAAVATTNFVAFIECNDMINLKHPVAVVRSIDQN